MKKLVHSTVLAALSSLACVQFASAATFSGIHPLQSDPFVFSVGAFWADISSEAGLAINNSQKDDEVDFQQDLGFGNSDTLPAFLLNWRITNNSRVSAEYFTIGQDNSGRADRTFTWDGVEFNAGVKVKTNLDLDIGRLFYGYSLIKDDKKEFGLGLGLHYLSIDTAVAGEANINGIPIGRVKRGFDDWAVLPNVGIYGNYALSPKWLLKARIDWISTNLGDYDGTLWNNEAAIQYQMFKNAGIGLAYRYLSFDIAADKSNKSWAIDLDYGGPLLFVTVNF